MRSPLPSRPAALAVVAFVSLVPVGCAKLIPGIGAALPRDDKKAETPTVAADPAVITDSPDEPAIPPKGGAPAVPASRPGIAAGTLPGGESFLPAAGAPPSAPLRPRSNDTTFSLANARLEMPQMGGGRFGGPPRMGGPAIMVDWARAFEGTNNGMALVLRAANGQDQTVPLSGGFGDRAGTIQLEVPYRGPFTGKVPDNAELYLVRTETRYGTNFHRTFKVSNSVLLGKTAFPITQAREWTADEQAKLSVPPPPPPPTPKAPDGSPSDPGLGEATELVGQPPPHGAKKWFVQAGKPMVGIDWWPGGWDGELCLRNVTPVFERTAPATGGTRQIGKPGYVVGGMTVKWNKFVDAVKLTFVKQKPDGTLDLADKYDSPWYGVPASGKQEAVLGNDGRPLIGLTGDRFGAMHAIGAIIAEK